MDREIDNLLHNVFHTIRQVNFWRDLKSDSKMYGENEEIKKQIDTHLGLWEHAEHEFKEKFYACH